MYPNNRKKILDILNQNNFDYPICIDDNDSLNILNHFPQEMSFQTFLLNQDNEVLAIGNPVLNPKIKRLYCDIVSNKKSFVNNSSIPITKIAISEQLIYMGNFPWKEKQEKDLIIRNTGQAPFVIDEILTSCGCINIDYNKKTILPNDSICVKVIYQAEHPEHFNKTITIYCNAENAPVKLKVSGDAK